MARSEELTDIPPDEVEGVIADFVSEGGTIEKIKQDDGNWTIKATFPENEDHFDCCGRGISEGEITHDEDLPTAVGGVEI